MASAQEIAIQALAQIRNATILWRRGKETEKIRELAKIASDALSEIEALANGS